MCRIIVLSSTLLFSIVIAWVFMPSGGSVLQADGTSFDSLVASSDVVFVNFYADWCRFSQMLAPVFEETSNRFTDTKKVAFLKVDCDRHVDVATKYHINKYPTLKMWRNGQLAKREYRGQRSVEGMASFVESQLQDPLKEFSSPQDLDSKINTKKGAVIAYFPMKAGPEWENLQRVAANLREECEFLVGIGDGFKDHLIGGPNIAFRPPRSHEDQVFSGNLADAEYVRQWVTDKCIPLVREITFENAEELTEEGLPFLILFKHPDDAQVLETFTQEVARQLSDQKTAVNFLYADGQKFAHPLHHLGKSEKDLPVLAIDSFRHMYLFSDVKEITTPGKLRQFILDLHSGKLHREFHHGPDPTQAPDPNQPHPPSQQPDGEQSGQPSQDRTSPPESTFQKLKPSRNRYTILKDEL